MQRSIESKYMYQSLLGWIYIFVGLVSISVEQGINLCWPQFHCASCAATLWPHVLSHCALLCCFIVPSCAASLCQYTTSSFPHVLPYCIPHGVSLCPHVLPHCAPSPCAASLCLLPMCCLTVPLSCAASLCLIYCDIVSPFAVSLSQCSA